MAGLMIRLKKNEVNPTVSAAAATWGVCAHDEMALFVGGNLTGRQKGVQVCGALGKMAHQVARKKLAAPPGVAATGTITVTAVLAADDKVTVAGVDFALKAVPVGDEVLIGLDEAATAVSLAAAINANVTTKALVVASSALAVVTLTAKARNLAGNAITLAETGTSFDISGATLAGAAVKVNVYKMAPGASTVLYSTTATAVATGVDDDTVAIVVGDDFHFMLQRSVMFLSLVDRALRYFKQAVAFKA